jgi:Zn finger protein HypA/HybF involved in hydrogenase expression
MTYKEMIMEIKNQHAIIGNARMEIDCEKGTVFARENSDTHEWEWSFYKKHECPGCHKTEGLSWENCPFCESLYQPPKG